MAKSKDAEIERLNHECDASMATIAEERARAEDAEADVERLTRERDGARRDAGIESDEPTYDQLFDRCCGLEGALRAAEARSEKLREALEPFAKIADDIEKCCAEFDGPESKPENWSKACEWDDLLAVRVALRATDGERADG